MNLTMMRKANRTMVHLPHGYRGWSKHRKHFARPTSSLNVTSSDIAAQRSRRTWGRDGREAKSNLTLGNALVRGRHARQRASCERGE